MRKVDRRRDRLVADRRLRLVIDVDEQRLLNGTQTTCVRGVVHGTAENSAGVAGQRQADRATADRIALTERSVRPTDGVPVQFREQILPRVLSGQTEHNVGLHESDIPFQIPVTAERCVARGIDRTGHVRTGQVREHLLGRESHQSLRKVATVNQDVRVGSQMLTELLQPIGVLAAHRVEIQHRRTELQLPAHSVRDEMNRAHVVPLRQHFENLIDTVATRIELNHFGSRIDSRDQRRRVHHSGIDEDQFVPHVRRRGVQFGTLLVGGRQQLPSDLVRIERRTCPGIKHRRRRTIHGGSTRSVRIGNQRVVGRGVPRQIGDDLRNVFERRDHANIRRLADRSRLLHRLLRRRSRLSHLQIHIHRCHRPGIEQQPVFQSLQQHATTRHGRGRTLRQLGEAVGNECFEKKTPHATPSPRGDRTRGSFLRIGFIGLFVTSQAQNLREP